jgi:hypothetical protein
MNGVRLSQVIVSPLNPPALTCNVVPVLGPELDKVVNPPILIFVYPDDPILIEPLAGPPTPKPSEINIDPPVPDPTASAAFKVSDPPFPVEVGLSILNVLFPEIKVKLPDPVIFPNLSILNNVEDPLVSVNEAVLTFTDADTLPLVIWNKFNPATFEAKTNDAVCAFEALRAYDADTALLAQLAVPNNEPVTLAFEPDTIMASALYCPILTVVSEKASITGMPEMSFTANNDPDSWSVTENN